MIVMFITEKTCFGFKVNVIKYCSGIYLIYTFCTCKVILPQILSNISEGGLKSLTVKF